MALKEALASLKDNYEVKKPDILSTVGLFGMGVTLGLGIFMTIKAVKAVEMVEVEKKKEAAEKAEVLNQPVEEVKLTPVEVTKVVWKYYIPVITLGLASGYCIIKSNKEYASRLVTVTAAYKLNEKTLTEYKNKVKEILGEKNEKKVQDSLAQARTEDNPPDEACVVSTGKGETLCREELTGRYFRSSKQSIESAVNKLNYEGLISMWTSVNDFFDAIELEEVVLGNDMGWEGLIEPVFSSALTANGTPILAVDFVNLPRPRNKYINH